MLMQKCSILLTSYHITVAIFAETLAVFFSLTMFHHFFLNDFHQFGNKNAVKRFTQRVLRANFSNLFSIELQQQRARPSCFHHPFMDTLTFKSDEHSWAVLCMI